MQKLALEGGVEGLGEGVVGAAPDRAHRLPDPKLDAELGVGPGCVLRPMIAVEDRAGQASTGRGGVLQGVGDEVGAHVIGTAQPTRRRL